MFFFGNSSVIFCVELSDAVLRGAVVKSKGAQSEILEKAEEQVPEGAVKQGEVTNPQAAGEALLSLTRKFKHKLKKLPAYVALPASRTFTAYVEGIASMPKNRSLLNDLAAQWLPFGPEEIVTKHLWQPSPPALTIAAAETNVLKGYRTIFAKAELKQPVLVPRTHGLVLSAFGPTGPATPSILLDLNAAAPVLTLAVGASVIDERILHSATPNEEYCETIFTWIPRVLMQHTPAVAPKSEKELKKEEKERAKQEKMKAKEEAKRAKEAAKDAKKGATPPQAAEPPKSVTATVAEEKLVITEPAVPTMDMDRQMAVPMTIFGDESHPFDIACRKLQNVSIVTKYVKLDDPAYAFAVSLGAAHGKIGMLPTFS